MRAEADDILVEQPVVATILVAVVATVAYAGIQVVLGGSVVPLETAIFTVVFTLVYVSGNYYLRRNQDESGGEGEAVDEG